MTGWFRSWHGAPTDPKWLGVAKRAETQCNARVTPATVFAISWALMDRASQSEERGSISGYDSDGLACFFGCESEHVEAVISALRDKGILIGDRFASWEKRQPKREDDSSSRVRGFRERLRNEPKRGVTHCNAPDTDTDTDKKEILSENEVSDPPARERKSRKQQYPPEFDAFWKAYPTDANMSKLAAHSVWERLDPDDREKATRSLPAFRAYCRQHEKTGYRPIHAERYLKHRRFEGHAEVATKAAASEGVFIRLNTPQWSAWDSYLKSTKGAGSPINRDGGWHFPTEWPPQSGAAA